ncbi:rDNA transcriptional regulator pol5 [Tribolium madens]|uniref:rDNA transcriptional regulator pol5 n=1 Tax=Tribolium madens TaxID=41895 RepID=UPI001CF766A6|nr:rDNA transcriptional regulator pol5 [Tribolium madens]
MAGEEHVEIVENGENHQKTNKRKREPSVLDNFTKLTNGLEKVRVKAGVDLLRYLTSDKNGEQGVDELKYALGRLIRGLGSSKIQAKTGFFSALVALLNLKSFTIEEIFTHVEKELHKGGSNSKSENADICSGQILLCGAILRSNLYENCDEKEKIKIVEMLLKAGKERSYLNLASCKFLTDLFEKIEQKEFENLFFPLVKSDLAKPWQEHSLDTLFLLLQIQNHFPGSLHSKFLKNNLGTEEVICSESLYDLALTLTTIPRVSSLKHPIFDLFINILSHTDLIVNFFNELDRTLIRQNRNKFFVATRLLTGILNELNDPSLIPELLTRNYLQQLINTYKTAVGKQKDKEFQNLTQKLFETLVNSLKKDGVKSKIKIKVLKALLFYPGTFIFEKVTKSKLVQNITASLNTEGVKKLAGIYRDVILATNDKVVNDNTREKWWNVDRIYASHLLVKLLNHPSMHDNNEWKVEQLVFLMKLGLLKDDNIGHELADSFKETFYSSLDLKLSKLDDLRQILSKITQEFATLVALVRHPLSEENGEMWQRTLDLATKLENSSKKKNSVFHTLFLHLGLQLFNNNNTKLASDSLEELFVCYDKTKKKSVDENDLVWIEVVVDLFLNLLSHNSHLLRSVINCVFPHLCKYMTDSAIHQILSVLDPKNDSNPLTRVDESSSDEEEEVEDEEEEEEEEESDEEEEEPVNDKLRMALHQALGANVDSEAESIDLDDLDDEEGEKLDEALSQAFKQFKPNLGKRKKQKKDEEALTHFRIRVLDLIEIYLNSNPSMILTLEIMLPLLQCLEFCIRDDHQKPLQDRLKSCLKKLSSLKKFEDCEGVNEEILVDLLKSLLEKGTRNVIIIQEMAEKISECCIFVINCSELVIMKKKKKSGIKAVIKDGLEAFFTRRDCVIPYVLFKNLVQTNWEGVLGLVSHLFGFVFANSIRPFRRSQAVELLKIFFNNHRFFTMHSEESKSVEGHTRNFLRDCVDFFREFYANPTERKVKEKFLAALFELLAQLKGNFLGQDFENWGVLGDSVRDCRSILTFSKDTKVAFNKLCNSLKISNVVEMMKQKTVKLNTVEEGESEEKEEEKRKKKKLSKDKLKLKKESKELRLQSLSKGLKRKFEWEEDEETKRVKN